MATLYRDVEGYLRSLGLQIDISEFPPWRAAILLPALCLQSYGLAYDQGADNVLRGNAEERGLPVSFLEDSLRPFELISRACAGTGDDLALLRDHLAQARNGALVSELHRVHDAWVRSDVSELSAIHAERLKQSPTVFGALITERNREWVRPALRVLDSDSPHLIAVGALHTVGPDNFLDLLQQEGYSSALIQFDAA